MDSLFEFDGNLLIGIQRLLNADWLTPLMKAITMLSEAGAFWIILCIILLVFRKTRRLGIICSFSLAFTFICCNLILKPLVDRDRPWEVYSEVIRMMADPGDASFPSGHTMNAMGTAWAVYINTLPAKLPLINEERGSRRVIKSYDDVTCLGWKGSGADPRRMHRLGIILVILSLLIGVSRLYLGMHFPTDVLCGLLLGMICATIVHIVIKNYESKHDIIGG